VDGVNGVTQRVLRCTCPPSPCRGELLVPSVTNARVQQHQARGGGGQNPLAIVRDVDGGDGGAHE